VKCTVCGDPTHDLESCEFVVTARALVDHARTARRLHFELTQRLAKARGKHGWKSRVPFPTGAAWPDLRNYEG